MSDARTETPVPPANVARAYDRWSSSYDTDANRTRDLDAIVLREAPLDLDGRRVLELGCGTGKNTAWLATRARSVTALDFSPGMLAAARERVALPTVHFDEHDIRLPLPLAAGTVDVVVANLVFEHIHDLAPIVAESARMLTVGGQLFFCELHPSRQIRGGQAHLADPATGEVVVIAAYRYTTSEYVNAAIGAGLTISSLGEWFDAGAMPEPPRLLSVLCAHR